MTQCTILVALSQIAFDSITAMADPLALERSSLSRNLTRLEIRGPVRMQEGGRSQAIEITDAEAEKLEETYPLWRAVREKVGDAIGAET